MKKHIVGPTVALSLLLCLLSGCGTQNGLVGTWETEAEMSVIGVGVSDEQTPESCTVRFTFQKDQSGSMTVQPDGDLYPDETRAFRYTAEGGQLTLTYDEGGSDVFAFTVKGNALTLEGRAKYELAKIA